jgi:hypothetical protein
MNRISANLKTILRLLPRTAVMLMLLAAPVLAVPSIHSGNGATIEAPAMKKTGAGLVLLVSLQRD